MNVKLILRFLIGGLLFLVQSQALIQDCSLKDGKYKLTYNSKSSSELDFQFILKGEEFIVNDGEQLQSFNISWLTKNSFRLKNLNSSDTDTSMIVRQLRSLGVPYYELGGCKGDTVNFILRHNKDVIISTGFITKED